MIGPQIKGLDKDNLRRLYVDNPDASLESVALELGCNRETVRRWMRRHGLPIRPRGGTGKPLLKESQPLTDREWLDVQLETKTQGQIADELGVSRGVVTSWVKKHGLWSDYAIMRSESIKESLKKRYPNGRRGEDHPLWKGGKRIADGYIYIYAPGHPATSPGRPYVQEHRLVMEEKLGRLLEPYEVVHHKDGDRTNNDPDNLVVKNRGDHLSEHFKASHEVLELRQENEYLLQRVAELEERIRKLEE